MPAVFREVRGERVNAGWVLELPGGGVVFFRPDEARWFSALFFVNVSTAEEHAQPEVEVDDFVVVPPVLVRSTFLRRAGLPEDDLAACISEACTATDPDAPPSLDANKGVLLSIQAWFLTCKLIGVLQYEQQQQRQHHAPVTVTVDGGVAHLTRNSVFESVGQRRPPLPTFADDDQAAAATPPSPHVHLGLRVICLPASGSPTAYAPDSGGGSGGGSNSGVTWFELVLHELVPGSTQPGAVVTTVERRFRDFEWLRERLRLTVPGLIVPPLPPKSKPWSSTVDTTERAAGLQRFLDWLLRHPRLVEGSVFRSFELELLLKASGDGLERAKSVLPAAGQGAHLELDFHVESQLSTQLGGTFGSTCGRLLAESMFASSGGAMVMLGAVSMGSALGTAGALAAAAVHSAQHESKQAQLASYRQASNKVIGSISRLSWSILTWAQHSARYMLHSPTLEDMTGSPLRGGAPPVFPAHHADDQPYDGFDRAAETRKAVLHTPLAAAASKADALTTASEARDDAVRAISTGVVLWTLCDPEAGKAARQTAPAVAAAAANGVENSKLSQAHRQQRSVPPPAPALQLPPATPGPGQSLREVLRFHVGVAESERDMADGRKRLVARIHCINDTLAERLRARGDEPTPRPQSPRSLIAGGEWSGSVSTAQEVHAEQARRDELRLRCQRIAAAYPIEVAVADAERIRDVRPALLALVWKRATMARVARDAAGDLLDCLDPSPEELRDSRERIGTVGDSIGPRAAGLPTFGSGPWLLLPTPPPTAPSVLRRPPPTAVDEDLPA